MINKSVETIKGAKEAFENFFRAGVGNTKNYMMQRKLKKLKTKRNKTNTKEEAKKKFKEQTGRTFYSDNDSLHSKDMAIMNKIMKNLKK